MVILRSIRASLLVVLAALVMSVSEVAAQAPDTVQLPHWEADLSGSLNASQAGYRNWAEGGISTLATTAQVNGKFDRTSVNWLQSYELRLGIGVVKQDTLDFRKAEDIVRLKGQVGYRGGGFFRKFNPTAAAGLRTQFAPGYAYKENPFEDDDTLPVMVSDVFSPATFTQSLGLSYSSAWGFSQRLGVAAKETMVLVQKFRPLYGLGRSEAVRFQLGVESQTELDKEIFQNVRYKSSLGLFAAFNQEELPDMLWENVVVMKVNKWLSADFEIVTLYDRDISDDLQIKEVLSISVSVIII